MGYVWHSMSGAKKVKKISVQLEEWEEKMGFVLKWIKWITFCISSVKFSVLINGAPTRFFRAQMGLCPLNPLSPFLFLLVTEGLNKTTDTNCWLRGFDVANNGRESLEVTHLQYAFAICR